MKQPVHPLDVMNALRGLLDSAGLGGAYVSANGVPNVVAVTFYDCTSQWRHAAKPDGTVPAVHGLLRGLGWGVTEEYGGRGGIDCMPRLSDDDIPF